MSQATMALVCAAVVLSAAPAAAKEITVTGTVTYAVTWSESTPLPDGGQIVQILQKGVIRDSDAATPFNFASQDCIGTLIIKKDGGPGTGGGSCMALDKDGEAFWIWWTSGASNDWGVFAGTGKYAGMTGTGSVTREVELPDRQSATYRGTLTMK